MFNTLALPYPWLCLHPIHIIMHLYMGEKRMHHTGLTNAGLTSNEDELTLAV
jgi:hypothetical protein